MLAFFSFLGPLGASWTFHGHFWLVLACFLVGLDRFGLDFGWFWVGPGRVLEDREAYFSRFFRTSSSKLVFFETSKKPRKTNCFFNIFKKSMV